MAGNPLKKVRSGDKLSISAEAFNAFIDAAIDYRNRRNVQGGESTPQTPSSTIVLVRNQTSGDLSRFSVLALDGPIVTPSQNLSAFQNTIAFDGVLPSSGTNERIAILWQPAPIGSIVRACVAGVTAARVDVTDENHTHAVPVAGEASYLRSHRSGPAAIIWKASGTGVQDAIVLLPVAVSRLIRIQLDTAFDASRSAAAHVVDAQGQQTTEVITVYDPLSFWVGAQGKRGYAQWQPDAARYEVIQLEC